MSEQSSVSHGSPRSDRPWLWAPGQSGNPGGRPKGPEDINALAKRYGPRALHVIAELLDDNDSRIRLAAANSLLDRGYGKPAQSVSVDGVDGNSVTLMHLLAAKAIARLEEGPTLEARVVADDTTKAQPTNGTAPKPNIFEPASE